MLYYQLEANIAGKWKVVTDGIYATPNFRELLTVFKPTEGQRFKRLPVCPDVPNFILKNSKLISYNG
jgi:hypothetical protein